MFGCRALYHRGWKAVTYRPMMDPRPHEEDRWELYDVEADPSECHDLAAREPDRLAEMFDAWWEEAARYQVLPIDNRAFSELTLERPGVPAVGRREITYRPGTGMVPEEATIALHDRTHTIRADVVVPDGGVAGVLLSLGNLTGGFSFFVQDGRLAYLHNFVGKEWTRVDGPLDAPPGAHCFEMRFERTGSHRGTVRLAVDGDVVGEGEIPRFTPVRWNLVGAGLVCGADPGLAVGDDYDAPFRFTGTIERVTVTVAGERSEDPRAAATIAAARQ
jgi:arylsulfatase